MNPEIQRKARMWLALVFVLGAGVGGVFGYGFAQRSHVSNSEPSTSLSEPQRRAKRVAEMTQEIGLTSEQAQKVDAIIHAAHDEMRAIHDKSDADVNAMREKARAQMRELLTAEQKPKFEALIQKIDAQRKNQSGGK